MSATITWSIAQLDRHTADGIVYTAHYRVDASDGTYTAGAYGSLSFEAPAEGEAVIPYSDLTEATVLGWIGSSLGEERVAEVEAILQAKIDEQHAPSTASGTPW